MPSKAPNKLPLFLLISLIGVSTVVAVLLVLIVVPWFWNTRPAPSRTPPPVLDPKQKADPQPDPEPDATIRKDFEILLDLPPDQSPDSAESTFFVDLTEHSPQRFEVWQNAADRGSPYGQYLVGRRAYHGTSFESDGPKAFHYFELAAMQGLPAARFMLAECYQHGVGVPADQHDQALSLAATWYHLAALQQFPPAQYKIGLCNELGNGIEPNLPWAIFWYEQAARQEHVLAAYRLGLCYAEGKGVEVNRDLAEHYLTLAADHGCPEAREALKSLHADQEGMP